MGLLDRFRSAGRDLAGRKGSEPDPAVREALRLVDEGNADEQAGRPEEAMQHYEAALRLAPNLARAHLNRGNILLGNGDWEAAVEAYASALAHDPDYASAHYNTGNAYVQGGRQEAASAAYRAAIALRPDFADAEVAMGYVQEELGQLDAAVASYRRALKINANYVEVYGNLGHALQKLGQLDDAVATYRTALEVKPDFIIAHINLGNVFKRLGQLDSAAASYRRALQVKPDYADAHCNLGTVLQDLGQLDDAVGSYRRALEIKPDLVIARFNLANALKDLGQLDDAVASYRLAAELKPDFEAAHCNLGNALQDLRQLDAAVVSYQRALEIKPDFAEAHCNLGNVFKDLGELDEAVLSYRRAVEIKPDFAEAHSNLGNALKDLGQLEGAVASYRRAVDLQPEFAEAHSNLGNALQDLRQFDGAMASYRRALQIKPDLPTAHSNLGNALRSLGQLDMAVASYRRALEIKPDLTEAHYNLGNALSDTGRPADAIASYRRALLIDPDYVKAIHNCGNALYDAGKLDDAAALYRRALGIKPEFAMAHTGLLFCLSHNETISSRALFAEHCRFAEVFESPLRASWPQHRNVPAPGRRLQIGFVSGDLRSHAVAYFVEPLLAHLCASPALELHAYYNHTGEDAVTKRLRGLMQHWHAIADLSDAALAQRIGEDGIDILIDLAGHTAENRLLTFARKPAPVQASWIGNPGTTGLSAMDYYLADRYFLPPGEFDGQFSEKLVYLPATAPFLPHDKAPPVNALPALSNGYVTFGSFNRISKIGASTIALWARLLRALPDARMLMGGMPQYGEYDGLIDLFSHEGINRERLSFHSRCGTADYLALHHQVDMCLDTFPFTGYTVTNHALWMGVPTLTLAGQTAAGRQGAALMGRIGLDAFVAKDARDFQEKGLHWASDLAALAAVREGLRDRCEQSPGRRPEVIAAGLESALRTMWQRWCAGLPAESFAVIP